MDNRLLQEVTRNIETALREDEVFKDLTTEACLTKSEEGEVLINVKERATLAGLPLLSMIAYAVDPRVRITPMAVDGDQVSAGTSVATLRGPMRALLSMERTLLNFFQFATSIATQTAQYVREVEGKCAILDTRKTVPCHRFLQKYATKMGGGKNHRFHLADQILIKDNHLFSLSIKEAIEQSRQRYPSKRIQVEVENLTMFQEALEERPDAILFDNMPIIEIREAISKFQTSAQSLYLEASGGINLQNIRSYAETGVNGISVGKLTHSIAAIDMSIEPSTIRRN